MRSRLSNSIRAVSHDLIARSRSVAGIALVDDLRAQPVLMRRHLLSVDRLITARMRSVVGFCVQVDDGLRGRAVPALCGEVIMIMAEVRAHHDQGLGTAPQQR